MVLDALVKINDQIDPSLSYRRSCREGVCGSCAMNIDGKNHLACLTPMDSLKKGTSRITPLPHMPVLRDLIPDLSGLYAQYELIEPWLQTDQPAPDRERRQSPEERAKLDGMWECILCFCCSTSCPSYWWNQDRYLGPSILLQSYRWLADSRDQHTGDRLDRLEACQKFDHIFRPPRGMYLPISARGRLKELLAQLAGEGRALHRRHRRRAHPRPRRPGRRRHGHPGRQAGALHRLRRRAAAVLPADHPRRRHQQRDPAGRSALPRPAPARACAAPSTDAFIDEFVDGGAGRSIRTAASSGRTSPTSTPCRSWRATATGSAPTTTTSRAPPPWRWPAFSAPCASPDRSSPTSASCSSAAGSAGTGIAELISQAMTHEGLDLAEARRRNGCST